MALIITLIDEFGGRFRIISIMAVIQFITEYANIAAPAIAAKNASAVPHAGTRSIPQAPDGTETAAMITAADSERGIVAEQQNRRVRKRGNYSRDSGYYDSKHYLPVRRALFGGLKI